MAAAAFLDGDVGTSAISSASVSWREREVFNLVFHVSELKHLQSASKGEEARRVFLSGLQIKVAVVCSSPNSSAFPPLAHSYFSL